MQLLTGRYVKNKHPVALDTDPAAACLQYGYLAVAGIFHIFAQLLKLLN
jgi:hypothetical protein